MKLGKRRAHESDPETPSKKRKKAKGDGTKAAVQDSAGAIGARSQGPAPKEHVAPPTCGGHAGSGIWWHRCRRLVTNCIASDLYEVVGKSLITWAPAEVLAMCGPPHLQPHTFAAVFAEWPADKLAMLLAQCPVEFISLACTSWPEDQLAAVLPKLRTKVARQVLRALYFDARDPHLDVLDVRLILDAMPERKKEKLLRKIKNKAAVHRVLTADINEVDQVDEKDDLRGPGSDDDDTYEDSFIDDEEDGSGSDSDAHQPDPTLEDSI